MVALVLVSLQENVGLTELFLAEHHDTTANLSGMIPWTAIAPYRHLIWIPPRAYAGAGDSKRPIKS